MNEMGTMDTVTRLVRYCHQGEEFAQRLFDEVISQGMLDIKMPEGMMHLSQEEHDEFVARFSAEVGPTLWISKRRKH
ncbi:MAG: hypothetical protein C0621_10260 [Desulfuromonas sp.]|nr:MAG: hypothetical protein C0621_10260 [Desulfuromonas sp.]